VRDGRDEGDGWVFLGWEIEDYDDRDGLMREWRWQDQWRLGGRF